MSRPGKVLAESETRLIVEHAWNGGPERVTAPYAKSIELRNRPPEYHVEGLSCGNPGGPPSKAKYSWRPIANEYREGKVKSTPVRGVKQYLKPRAYKQSEGVAGSASADPVA
jgi:hypothetical protein